MTTVLHINLLSMRRSRVWLVFKAYDIATMQGLHTATQLSLPADLCSSRRPAYTPACASARVFSRFGSTPCWAHLELPLCWHDLGVDARDPDAGKHTALEVRLHDVAADSSACAG